MHADNEAPKTQITVRGIDRSLNQELKHQAHQSGLSVNRLVLRILREATGLENKVDTRHQKFTDLDYLAGTWSAEDEAEFADTLNNQRPIDDELWPE